MPSAASFTTKPANASTLLKRERTSALSSTSSTVLRRIVFEALHKTTAPTDEPAREAELYDAGGFQETDWFPVTLPSIPASISFSNDSVISARRQPRRT